MSKQKNKKKNANKGNQSYDAPDTRVIDNSGNAGYMPDKTKLEEAIYNAFPKLLDPKGNKQDAGMIRHEYYLNDKALGNPKILPQLKGDDIYRKNNGIKILFPNRNYERFDLNRLGDNQGTEMYETNAGQNSMPNANTSQTPMPNAFSPFDFSKLRWDNASYLPEFNNMVYGLNEMDFDVTGKPTNAYRNKAAFQNRLNKNDSRKSYADPTGTGALYLTEDQKYQYANGGDVTSSYKSGGQCKGGCQMKAGGKTCAKCGCDMSPSKMANGGETYKSGGSACMKCGGKMHKSGGTVSSCIKCGGGKYTFGGKTGWSKKKDDVSKYKNGGYIQAQSGWNGEAFDPIYVSNQNDPRLKSYQDSTALYNNYMNNYNVIKSGGKYNNTVETTKPAIYSISETWKDINPNNKLTYKKADDFGFHVIDKNGHPELTFMSNKNIQPIATETFTRKESKYPSVKSFDEYAKIIKSQGGTFSEKPNEANWVGYELQKYKKPVQPIVYKKPDIRVPEMSVEETTKMMNRLEQNRKEKEDYAAYEKWISENPLAEPEHRVNEEMEINPWKIINMPTKSPELIQRNEMLPNINTGIKYEKESGEGAYPMMMSNEGQGTVNKKGKRKYQFGGEADNTSMTSDTEIPVSKGSFNVEAPPYNVSEMLGLKSMSIQEETTPEDTKKISNVISKQKTKGDDKTMPNWGRAQKEQMMLNDLIRKDIASGKTDMNVLAEDDIIGDLTLAAMNRYEGKGYTRPELFKDKWLAEYKKQWEEMQSGKKSQQQKQTSQQSSNKKQVFNPDVNVIPKKQNENYLTAAGFKKMNSSQIEEVGDGDGIKVNGKNYRLAGIDDAGAFFDAAESRYYKDNIKMMQYQTSFMGFDFSDATSRILGKNESTKTLKDAIGNKNVMIKEGGTTKDGRSTAVLYYQDDLNPMLYHSADSLIVTKGQGVYGMNFNDSKMTPRQKDITSKAEKYNYPTTPYNARKNPGKYMIPSKASKEISAWDIFNTVQKNSQRKPK